MPLPDAQSLITRVHQLVEEAARQHPDQPAVQFGATLLTYGQLNKAANRLAAAIGQQAPEARFIGVSASRSEQMVVRVLAILKSGRAYLPLDPSQPPARLRQIVQDAALTHYVADEGEAVLFNELGLTAITDAFSNGQPPVPGPQPSTLCYILFTSGSTGQPKGVSMGHGPLVNLLQWQGKQSKAGVGTRTAAFAPLTFDVSFQEIFATLGTGGTLVVMSDDERLALHELPQWLTTERIERLFLPFVALNYLAEAAERTAVFPATLREIMTAGEALTITPALVTFFKALPDCALFNQYGPTEAHVVSQLALTGDPTAWPARPGIGQPIDNVVWHVVDETLRPLPLGEVGELLLGGACLAEGYLNRPALTAEKFVQLTQGGRFYRTGDLAKMQPDGSVEFLGRADDQVKIRGHRVELGDVEAALSRAPGVRQAVVTAPVRNGQAQLIGYVVADEFNPLTLRSALEAALPDYMVPTYFVQVATFPKTSSGKIDRKALPLPDRTRPALPTPLRAPRTETERNLVKLWSDVLQFDRVGVDDNFFDLGGNSLLAQQVVVGAATFGLTVPITKLYQFPTVADLAGWLDKTLQSSAQSSSEDFSLLPSSSEDGHDIAVISMAGRFPGAETIAEFWQLLTEGRDAITFFGREELDATVPDDLKNDPHYVPARGIIAHAEAFDAGAFGLSPKVAEVMDPQQRVFLEICYEALEQSGYLPQHYAGRVGVWAGSGNNTYYLNNVLPNEAALARVGAFQAMTLNEKDYVASRVAYQLNLTGPAVSVYSACSTSLLAVTQAVEALRSGRCDVALAGGVSVTAPIRSGQLHQEGAMYSADGHTRSFDAAGSGTVFSDGAGVVLLKIRQAAERDGDPIFAIIKGVGVNNDGGGKGSFTAPSAEGQAGAIRAALADARVHPGSIGYVEAHGTATPLGDPIEIEGLKLAFGEQNNTAPADRSFCALGSVKSNIGHLTGAAGVAGLIKTVLALHHRQLLPTVHFERPNPALDLENSPFFVNATLREWTVEGLRQAGVSSFGVGGTNVHVVLEEAPEITTSEITTSASGNVPAVLLTWSAQSAESADAYGEKLMSYAENATGPPERLPVLANLAFTLQTTRPDRPHRRFAVWREGDDLTETLRSATQKHLTERPGDIVFLFPGQGAQYLNMGRALYDNAPTYRAVVDECATLLNGVLDVPLLDVLYGDSDPDAATERLKNTTYTQPALFVTELALAKLWLHWGLRPTALCGHSIGEWVAAHLAGVIDLPDALRLVVARGRMVSQQPRGSMLSVRASAGDVANRLPTDLDIAAVNSHNLCVVAGPDEAIDRFAAQLDADNVVNRRLVTSHAFHSTMMDPVVGEFEELLRSVPLQRPRLPIVSTVTGQWLTDAQATDPAYWATHLRKTVRFADALDFVLTQQNPLLLDVGPGNVAAVLARQQALPRAGRPAAPATILAGLEGGNGTSDDYGRMLKALGQVWAAGGTPNWRAVYEGQPRQRLHDVPTYAFHRKRCWLDPPKQAAPGPIIPESNVVVALENNHTTPSADPTPMNQALQNRIRQLLEDASGIDMAGVSPRLSFPEIGLDSLLLTQVALTLKKEFGLPITFRQLAERYDTLDALTAHIAQNTPPQTPSPSHQPSVARPPATAHQPPAPNHHPPAPDPTLALLAQQVQALASQLAVLQGQPPTPPPAPVTAATPTGVSVNGVPETVHQPFGATARIERKVQKGMTDAQREFIERLTRRYNRKTGGSKTFTGEHRPHMADPRAVTGFRPLTKELVYPIVVERSKGSRLWDIDGNEYVDALNGFGATFFGHQPDFLKDALHDQIENGYEVGPQHPMAGEVTALLCEFTGFDRAALCNTGSEAVLGALRMARTVTGRQTVVAFSNSYHGINDEVLVRGGRNGRPFPAASGVPPESVANMLILEYGTDETLRIIRERADELAAVLVEPVQSRRAEFRPIAFLQDVRAITEASGTALIFDEVITGFRAHPGGAQALFGIKADIGTYGKVIGGGLPIGAIAGKRQWMDTLDGGDWQYGDDSVPEVGVTYFAGTFVRHPLALAAARASLLKMKEEGPQLQERINAKAERLSTRLNAELEPRGLPMFISQFGSLWKLKYKEDVPYGELLFTLMREKGIHIWDGFPCFMTDAHTEQDVQRIGDVFLESLNELSAAGFYGTDHVASVQSNVAVSAARPLATTSVLNQPPVPGARLGRDQWGNPAWFTPDPARPGHYLQVDTD